MPTIIWKEGVILNYLDTCSLDNPVQNLFQEIKKYLLKEFN